MSRTSRFSFYQFCKFLSILFRKSEHVQKYTICYMPIRAMVSTFVMIDAFCLISVCLFVCLFILLRFIVYSTVCEFSIFKRDSIILLVVKVEGQNILKTNL